MICLENWMGLNMNKWKCTFTENRVCVIDAMHLLDAINVLKTSNIFNESIAFLTNIELVN
jgi:hypothetical protein